jgi:hypothetical protein
MERKSSRIFLTVPADLASALQTERSRLKAKNVQSIILSVVSEGLANRDRVSPPSTNGFLLKGAGSERVSDLKHSLQTPKT